LCNPEAVAQLQGKSNSQANVILHRTEQQRQEVEVLKIQAYIRGKL
jgi:hypothetical protein